MKKFYSLALALAVCVSANALELQKTVNPSLKATDSKTLSISGKKLEKKAIPAAKATAKAPAQDIQKRVEGEYLLICDAPDGENFMNRATCTISAGATDSTVVLHKFIFDDANDINAVVYHDEEYNIDVLKIPSKTVLFSEEGTDYSMMLFGYSNTGNASVYTNDLEFAIFDEGLQFLYEDCGIAWLDLTTMRGNWIVNPMLFRPNATYTTIDLDLTVNPIEETPLMGSSYVEYYEAQSSLIAFNFAGVPYAIIFNVNTETGEAQVVDALAYTGSNGAEYYIFSSDGSFDPSSDDSILNAKIENLGNGKSKLTVTDPAWWAFDPSTNYYLLAETNTEMEMDMEFETLPNYAGVKDIAVDNANAPVEYYNLQGVRVANPESGLYIRRQGTSATKVLVR